jgi:HEAT repeat protein
VPQAQLLKEVGTVSQDAAVRGVAMQLLGQRKVVAAVPALIDALKEPKGELRDQAIGALVAIGDRRAVRPLLNAVQFMDRVEMGKVLEAAAALGGEDARSYLVFVAQSHSDAGLRQEAKDALARLERKEAQAASAVSP